MPLPSPPTSSSHRRERGFWIQTDNFSTPPSRSFGGELLTALRSTRGGIHYVKSNQFKQVHCVDHRPIYTCALIPPHLVPYGEDNKFIITELGKGLIRREALDLLAYSYTETETGIFSVSGNLKLVCEKYSIHILGSSADCVLKREIEELVRLSYQARGRNLEERSKTVIKERGWGETVDIMNRSVPPVRLHQPWPAPHYPRPTPGSWGQHMPSYDGYFRHHPQREHEEIFPDEIRPAPLPPSRVHTGGEPPVRLHERPMVASTPIHLERPEQDATKPTRTEVRFTFPREQLVSGSVDTTQKGPSSPAKPGTSSSKADNQLQIVRQRLERLRKRKEEAEEAKDITTAADLTYYAIPELEADLEKLLLQQREELENSAARVFHNEEDKSRQAEVETESEGSEDEGGSEAQDLYE